MKKILIAGGGIAGTIIANRLARALSPEIEKGEVELTVLDKSDTHIYLPGQLFVAFGLTDPIEIMRKERDLLDHRIRFLHGQKGEIVKIDPANNSVKTADGNTHNYDYLVIATGVHYAWGEIEGYTKENVLTPWELDSAIKMREALMQIKEGNTVVINVARLPYRCPVGPLEVTCMLDDMLRRRGIRDKVRIIYTYPVQGVFGIKNVSDLFVKIFQERGIEIYSNFMVSKVDGQKKVIEAESGEKLNYDLLIGVPPHMGAKVIGDSGIGDRRNWVPTDKFTLQMKNYSNVYVIGDVTDIPISKAGSTADFESYVITHNLVNDIRGTGIKRNYDGSVFCYIATGLDSATYIRFNYNNPPTPPPPSYVHFWGKVMYNRLYWTVTAKALV
ncbi:MAG: FAD/NAD(P)-binding oxidoreductase [Ignisphaera sp.]